LTSLEVQTLLTAIHAPAEDSAMEFAPPNLQWLSEATDEEVDHLLSGLLQHPDSVAHGREKLLCVALHQLSMRLRNQDQPHLAPQTLSMIAALYRHLDQENRARCYLLQMLSVTAQPASLALFVKLVAEDPPLDREAVGLAFGPLFQRRDYPMEALFPDLLAAISQPSVAAPVMDLCNYVTREKLVSVHPATDRRQQFIALLGSLVQRLTGLEERGEVRDESLEDVAQLVDDSVALAIALCDALAQIGDEAAVGKLYQAMDLRHRRLRTEAAAALARLGEDAGRDALLKLSAEPVCRLRVLAYADELEFLDQVPQEFQTAAARGEAELALWLAQPTQFGIPPTSIELQDARTLYWPGFEHPVDCFLYHFTYRFADAEYANIGIAGPLAHAFAADLTGLSFDDAYAAFAGWHVQHEDIYELNVHEMTEDQRVEVSRLERKLHDAGYESLRPMQLGFFLGDRWLAAYSVQGGVTGTAIVDQQEIQWHPHEGYPRPRGTHEAVCIYKGRKLMESFNPSSD
jgi:hypothetical protein